MTIDRYTTLCERIRKHCQQNNWYGPDGYEPSHEPGYYDANRWWHDGEIPASGHYDLDGTWHAPDERIFDYRRYIDEYGKFRHHAITHDSRTGFEFPPATEEQIQVTEEALGIPLLPLLRALYTQLANGGFGPACGITGIRGGYYFGEDGHYRTMDRYTDNNPSKEYIDLAAHVSRLGYPHTFELPPNVWPAHFLQFCYAGCGDDVFVDGKSGWVYLVGAGHATQDGYTTFIKRLDHSLENWLECWLRDEKKTLWGW